MYETIHRAFQTFDKDDICSTPQDPDYSGFNSSYAFEPRGFRVSKVLYCTNSFSIRLINFKNWLTPHDEQGEVGKNCHELLNIARDLTQAIDNILKANRAKNVILLGKPIDATCYIPRQQLDDENYRICGSSWWGQDRTWELAIGQEGKRIKDHPRDDLDCSKMLKKSDFVTVTKPKR